jgi:predicted nucleotidyltransferase
MLFRDEDDIRVLQKLVYYLQSIEYWHDKDNGIWENDEERTSRLRAETGRILDKLKKDGSVDKVILFGSMAGGDVGRTTDIDLIVVKRTDRRFLDRLEEVYKLVRPKLSTDIFVYTPEEFEAMRASNRFLQSALRRGRILYEAGTEE